VLFFQPFSFFFFDWFLSRYAGFGISSSRFPVTWRRHPLNRRRARFCFFPFPEGSPFPSGLFLLGLINFVKPVHLACPLWWLFFFFFPLAGLVGADRGTTRIFQQFLVRFAGWSFREYVFTLIAPPPPSASTHWHLPLFSWVLLKPTIGDAGLFNYRRPPPTDTSSSSRLPPFPLNFFRLGQSMCFLETTTTVVLSTLTPHLNDSPFPPCPQALSNFSPIVPSSSFPSSQLFACTASSR